MAYGNFERRSLKRLARDKRLEKGEVVSSPFSQMNKRARNKLKRFRKKRKLGKIGLLKTAQKFLIEVREDIKKQIIEKQLIQTNQKELTEKQLNVAEHVADIETLFIAESPTIGATDAILEMRQTELKIAEGQIIEPAPQPFNLMKALGKA